MIFFKNQALMPLLWFVLALIPLLVGEFYLRRKQERQFLEGQSGKSPLKGDQLKRGLLLFFAALFALAALLRPSWNPTVRLVEKEGRDVVFLLDVSRSMTASDVAPTRLERAKLEIAETAQVVDGDRIALVAFAGNSVVKCPLTMDYGFFSQVLDDIDINSVSRGGSQLGDALRMVESQVFDDRTREERDIILITDGEDQESFPVEAAKALGEDGVRLIIIGLGDEIQGARVKDSDGNYLVHEGQEVWSRMNGDTLRKMAAATPGGSYIPAGQANFSLPALYRNLIGRSAKQSSGEEETLVYEEKYQFFLFLTLILLILEAFRLIGPFKVSFKLPSAPSKLSLLALFLVMAFVGNSQLHAEGRADLYSKGEKAYASGDWDSFKQIYEELAGRGVSEGKLSYNEGLAAYEQGDYAKAAGLFGDSAARLRDKQAAQALYNRGNALLKEGESNPSAELNGQAREAYEKALELDPSFTEAARNLEILLKQQEENPPDEENQDKSDGDDKSDKSDKSDQSDSSDSQDQSDQSESQEGNQDNPSDESAQSNDTQDEADEMAQDILNQEEEDREARESTLKVSGGIYQVEKDW
ncbi:MAG: VWA domain-containing protein [Spirochaetales bacterium]|nr:VWA domain-containing protein [Spirochaetales bacterium]